MGPALSLSIMRSQRPRCGTCPRSIMRSYRVPLCLWPPLTWTTTPKNQHSLTPFFREMGKLEVGRSTPDSVSLSEVKMKLWSSSNERIAYDKTEEPVRHFSLSLPCANKRPQKQRKINSAASIINRDELMRSSQQTERLRTPGQHITH